MITTEQPRQRDHARTRRSLLNAARDVIAQLGSSASLDTIAKVSGVSKGGLLHHFPNKDKLLVALADDLYSRFETGVADARAAEPEGPGRTLRAYVRVVLRQLVAPELAIDHRTLFNLIATVPSVAAFVSLRLADWTARCEAEGTPPEVVRLVMFAADGAAINLHTAPTTSPDAVADLEAELIALIEAQNPLVRLMNTQRS